MTPDFSFLNGFTVVLIGDTDEDYNIWKETKAKRLDGELSNYGYVTIEFLKLKDTWNNDFKNPEDIVFVFLPSIANHPDIHLYLADYIEYCYG